MVLFVDKLKIFFNILVLVVESHSVIEETKPYQPHGLITKEKKKFHTMYALVATNN